MVGRCPAEIVILSPATRPYNMFGAVNVPLTVAFASIERFSLKVEGRLNEIFPVRLSSAVVDACNTCLSADCLEKGKIDLRDEGRAVRGRCPFEVARKNARDMTERKNDEKKILFLFINFSITTQPTPFSGLYPAYVFY